MKGFVSKETVLLYQWRSETRENMKIWHQTSWLSSKYHGKKIETADLSSISLFIRINRTKCHQLLNLFMVVLWAFRILQRYPWFWSLVKYIVCTTHLTFMENKKLFFKLMTIDYFFSCLYSLLASILHLSEWKEDLRQGILVDLYFYTLQYPLFKNSCKENLFVWMISLELVALGDYF